MIQVRVTDTQLILPLRVTPRGGKDALLPFEAGDTVLNLKVSAPPEDGKANAAVEKLLASLLNIPKSRVKVIAGEKARNKQVAVTADSGKCEPLLAHLADRLAAGTPSTCFVILSKR